MSKWTKEVKEGRSYFYHKYDEKGRPVISVCLIFYDDSLTGIWSRGCTICSPLDYGVLKNIKGKRKAQARAREAYRQFIVYDEQFRFGKINREVALLQIKKSGAFDCFSAYNDGLWKAEAPTKLTNFEYDFIKRVNNNKKNSDIDKLKCLSDNGSFSFAKRILQRGLEQEAAMVK